MFLGSLTIEALHDEVMQRASQINGKVYLFFDEIQEVTAWEKCINSFRVETDCDIQIVCLLASEDTVRREFGAPAGVRDNFPKYVVTLIDAKLPQDPFWLYHRF